MGDALYRVACTAENAASSCRVSVLMATLGGPSLPSALASVLTLPVQLQSMVELVVVVDDPACDPGQILASLSPPQRAMVTLLHNTQNLGITRSLNAGLGFCRGDLVSRLDDDDRFTPQRLPLLLEFFDTHPDCDLVTGAAWVRQGGRRYLMQIPETHEKIARKLESRNILVHSALTIRTATLRRIGGYNDTFRYAQDYELYLRALRHGVRFAGLPVALVEREEGPNSITLSRRRQQALFSLAALSLHHALCWEGGRQSVSPVLAAVARFASPAFLRKGVRWVRARRRKVRLV